MFFDIIYKISIFLVKVYYIIFYKFSVEGIENIPKTGGGIIACNHKSNNDPPVIAAFVNRKISFVAKKELFENPIAGWYLEGVGALPISRGDTEVSTFKSILRMMKEGKLTLIFPTGTRKKISLDKVKDGAVVIASRSNVPVIPIAIVGNYKRFAKHKMIVGKPIYYDKVTADESHTLTIELMKEIYRMAGE